MRVMGVGLRSFKTRNLFNYKASKNKEIMKKCKNIVRKYIIAKSKKKKGVYKWLFYVTCVAMKMM